MEGWLEMDGWKTGKMDCWTKGWMDGWHSGAVARLVGWEAAFRVGLKDELCFVKGQEKICS